MNSTGRHGEKSAYLVILLLVVGLTAFSHSVKELTEIHHLTLDASRLIAQWSGNVTPVELPQTHTETIVKIQKPKSCESKQSALSLELPWLEETPKSTVPSALAPGRRPQSRSEKSQPGVITLPSQAEIAKLKELRRFEIDSAGFEVRVSVDEQNVDADEPIAVEIPLSTFKAKGRRPGVIRFNPPDREMILKTLNRSINLRIAS